MLPRTWWEESRQKPRSHILPCPSPVPPGYSHDRGRQRCRSPEVSLASWFSRPVGAPAPYLPRPLSQCGSSALLAPFVSSPSFVPPDRDFIWSKREDSARLSELSPVSRSGNARCMSRRERPSTSRLVGAIRTRILPAPNRVLHQVELRPDVIRRASRDRTGDLRSPRTACNLPHSSPVTSRRASSTFDSPRP